MISDGDEARLIRALRAVDGVIRVRTIETPVDFGGFPVGFEITGEYNPSLLQNAVCSNDYTVTNTKIRR